METWSGVVEAPAPPPVVAPPPADFSITVSPTSSEVMQGDSTIATVTITPSGGYSYTVTLNASGQPKGIVITFSPENGTPSFTSTMMVDVSRNTPVSTYAITITGKGVDGKTHSTSYSLTVTAPPIPTVTIQRIPAGGSATADFTPFRIFIVKVTVTVKSEVENAEIRAVQISIKEYQAMPEWARMPSGEVYRYFGIVTTNITSQGISSSVVEFKVLRSWVERNYLDERTIRLLRWSTRDNRWQKLSTRFSREDPDYLYFEASMEGLSLFAVTGEKKAIPLPVTPPASLYYTLLAMFSGLGGGLGYVAYVRWFRRIPPFATLRLLKRVSLRGMLMAKPVKIKGTDVATMLERLRDVTSVERVAWPITPVLKGYERAVVWKPRPLKVWVSKQTKMDINKFKRADLAYHNPQLYSK